MKIHLFLKQMLLLAVFAFSASLWGQTDNLTCTTGTIVGTQMTFNTTNFSIVHAKGTDANFATYSPWRIYTNNTVTFSAGANVKKITSIVITASTAAYATAANGTITVLSGTGTATGSVSGSDLTITVTGNDVKGILVKPSAQSRWNSIIINYELVSSGPTVTTTAATTISTTAATLNGSINANGVSTDASFDWGLTNAYGNNVAASPATITGTTVTAITGTLSSLAVNTQYHYRAVGTAGTAVNGSDLNFWTLANTPNAVTVNNAQLTTLDVALNTDGNPVTTEYTIEETTTGKFVQADGTLGATAVWQTSASWGTKTVTGLTAATEYTFQAKARNGANVETAFGTTASGTTSTPILVSYNLVQSPNTEQSPVEGTDLKVYIRAYAAGITEAAGESTRLKGWVGYSSTNDNPANTGWTWIPATFNAQYGNNDEYQANIPTNVPGTYYYAARFEIDNSGSFTYGGSAGNWNNDNVKLNVLADVVDYANIQSPATASIIAGNTVTVYAQVYELDVTEAAGQGAGISAEIGYSNTNGTPDGTWTWLPATFNVQSGNNDEYQADLGAGLSAGTYYYASRFKKSTSSTYVYGGTAGIWNNNSGVLTVSTLGIPTATAATDIASTSFTANWDAVSVADAYELDVYKVVNSPMTELIISEYVEGSSNNKAIEIYNGTGSTVNLSNYSLRKQSNGAGVYGDDLPLEGNLANGVTYVVANYSASNPVKLLAQQTSSAATMTFNGNDAVGLFKNGNKIDEVGVFNQTSDWGKDVTLRRKSNIGSPKLTYDNGDWDSFPTDTFDGLGSHVANTTTKTLVSSQNVGNVTSYLVSTLTPQTNYTYVVRAKAGAVTSANSNEISVTTLSTPTTTWNGTEWSNGVPDANKDAIINSDYSDAAFEAKSLTVNAGKTLTVNSFVKAVDVTNEGNILVANNANFVQTGNFTAGGSSTFKVNRTTKPVVRLDYNSWSSPMMVSDQTLKQFSPETLDARFLTYNNNKFEAVTSPATTKFTPGAGYLIRTSNTYTTTPTPFDGQFVGTVPNSGNVTYAPSIVGNYVFLGNPYPSAISMEDFYNENLAQMQTATFYIWNSESKMNTSNVYVNPYNTQTAAGSNPYGAEFYVPVGQGFLIDRGARTSSSFLFKNSMRRTAETGTFAKTAVADRFWLQMTSPSGLKPQLLVGFTSNATSGFDAGYDGKLLESNGDVIYSIVDNKSLVINALGTFSSTDIINVTANFASAGNYTFDIAQKEGVFENGQQIYLKDNVTGIETELTSANYTFAATAGLQADRFTVSFSKGVLASSNATKAQSTIYADHQIVHVKGASKIASVEVYDISGKLMKTTKNVNSENTSLEVAYNGVVVVKLVLENGEVVTKKVILK